MRTNIIFRKPTGFKEVAKVLYSIKSLIRKYQQSTPKIAVILPLLRKFPRCPCCYIIRHKHTIRKLEVFLLRSKVVIKNKIKILQNKTLVNNYFSQKLNTNSQSEEKIYNYYISSDNVHVKFSKLECYLKFLETSVIKI